MKKVGKKNLAPKEKDKNAFALSRGVYCGVLTK
jgi:hypothetical protein